MRRRQFLRQSILSSGALLLPVARAFSQEPSATSLSDEEKAQFLLTAEVLRTSTIPIGATLSKKAVLSDGRRTHEAQIQTVDVSKASYPTSRGTELNFRDSYKFNIAAYRLDRLLNLNMVPVSVERRIKNERAAVTWWVDDVLMMEKERLEQRVSAPNRVEWSDQIYQMRIFNELIYNTDANQGNLLITKDWKIRLIDFTRAFRLHKKLQNPGLIWRIDRRFYDGLKALSEPALQQEVGELLRKSEIRAVLARKDRILARLDKRIASEPVNTGFLGATR